MLPEWIYQGELKNIETVFALSIVAFSLLAPSFMGRWFSRLERPLRRFARRRILAASAVGLIVLAIRLALLSWYPVPVPTVHDEFSYLLLADTLAEGRLSNPTHPMWEYFETYHVNQKPTYGSKYPPGSAIPMALAQRLIGDPWFGVWLMTAAMCAAVCWALQAWFSPGWALFGGALFAARFGIVSYWMNSYWGGSMAAFGGALTIGAAVRALRRPTAGRGLVFGVGVMILANTRPFEGLALVIPVAGLLALAVWRSSGLKRVAWRRRFLPLAAATLALAGGAMAVYNVETTGDPLHFPYYVKNDGPLFAFEEAVARGENIPGQVIELNESLLEAHRRTRNFQTFVADRWANVKRLWQFFVDPLFTLPLLLLPWTLGDRRIRQAWIVLGFFCVPLAGMVWMQPHYAAPGHVVLWVVVVQGLRRMRHWRFRGRPAGLTLVRLTALVCLLMPVWCLAEWKYPQLPAPAGKWSQRCKHFADNLSMTRRESVRSRLLEQGGKHLVIVRYAIDGFTHNEWVYNAADIDASPVVWARFREGVPLKPLLEYFQDRQAWIVTVLGDDWDLRPLDLMGLPAAKPQGP